MKEIFLQFARYNKTANAEMMDIIDSAGDDFWTRPFAVYYKSVFGIVSHVVESDIRWLNRFGALSAEEYANYNNITLTIDTIRRYRGELDDRIVRCVEGTDDFEKPASFLFRGKDETMKVREWMLTWFNHHTHHRGNISTLLDMEGLDNDYSVMVGRFPPSASTACAPTTGVGKGSPAAIFENQLKAALCTLGQCIENCPDSEWNEAHGDAPFSQVIFHALFYADYYLQRNESEFRLQEYHRLNPGFFADYEELEDRVPVRRYEKEKCREYLGHCVRKCEAILAEDTAETLGGPSGIAWRKFSRAELYIYNIRHIQHHAAQLGLRVQIKTGKELKWVGGGWINP